MHASNIYTYNLGDPRENIDIEERQPSYRERERQRKERVGGRMDWDGSSLIRSSFVNPRPDNSSNANSSFSTFLFNCSVDQLPGNMETKHHHPFGMVPESSQAGSGLGGENCVSSGGYNISCYQERKKKLTSEQLDSLERSFQEEIKLDPDRKMKLSRELGLQPRQIAVWFQNRRARWKAKQLERLYDALKLEFDAISREKFSLQEEVLRLRSMIRDQATKKNTVGYTELSGEETVESTSINRPREVATAHHHHQFGATLAEYNNNISAAAATYWGSIVPSIYNNSTNNP